MEIIQALIWKLSMRSSLELILLTLHKTTEVLSVLCVLCFSLFLMNEERGIICHENETLQEKNSISLLDRGKPLEQYCRNSLIKIYLYLINAV